MDSELDTHIGTIIDPGIAPGTTPESKWTAWAIWSGLSLVLALLAVFAAGLDTGLLLGWAVGTIIAAMLIVFRR